MIVPPEDMWGDINNPQAAYDRMIAELQDNPGTYDVEDEWAKLPDRTFDVDPSPTTIAKLELKGTSTTNPKRPRTIAAGYDYPSGTLTVVFRDGTWWNYYKVPLETWDGFKGAVSKGEFLRASGLDEWDDMGPADRSGLSTHQQRALDYVVQGARAMQQATGGQQMMGDTRGARATNAWSKFAEGLGAE